MFFFFFNDTATTEIYTLSLHDALPISIQSPRRLLLRDGRQPRQQRRQPRVGSRPARPHRRSRHVRPLVLRRARAAQRRALPVQLRRPLRPQHTLGAHRHAPTVNPEAPPAENLPASPFKILYPP